MAFDAFISYSHSADDDFAPALQKALQRFAKPWMSRRALRIFRDNSALSVNPALWQSITNALDESRYFILLASPGAAQSEWVGKEIEYWMSTKHDAAQTILPVLTEGAFVWDADAEEIDWDASDAAHPALAGVFAEEPRHLDFVWAREAADLTLDNPRFRDAIADIAAPIHGIPKDELEGEDVREHRRAVRARRSALAALLALLLGIGVVGAFAFLSWRTLGDARHEKAAAEAAAEIAKKAKAEAESEKTEAEEAKVEAEAAQADAEGAAAAAREDQLNAESARADAERLQAEAVANAGRAETREIAAGLREAAAIEREQVARDAASAAETARGDAEDAQLRAEEVELAARFANLADASPYATDSALLAAESYCATARCGDSSSLRPLGTHRDFASLAPMIDSLSRHADAQELFSGYDGAASDLAISADGETIAVLGSDGSVFVWSHEYPAGRTLVGADPRTLAFDLSSDGSTIALLRSTCATEDSHSHCLEEEYVRSRVGRLETLHLVESRTGRETTPLMLDFDIREHRALTGTVEFAPGSNRVALVHLGRSSGGPYVLLATPDADPIRPAGTEYDLFVVPLSRGSAADLRIQLSTWTGAEVVLVSDTAVRVYAADGALRSDLPVSGLGGATAIASDGSLVRLSFANGVVSQVDPRDPTTTVVTATNRPVVDVSTTSEVAVFWTVNDTGSVHRIITDPGRSPANRTIEEADGFTPLIAQAADADVTVVLRGTVARTYSSTPTWMGADAWRGSAERVFLTATGTVGAAGELDRVRTIDIGELRTDGRLVALASDGEAAVREESPGSYTIGTELDTRVSLELPDAFVAQSWSLEDDRRIVAAGKTTRFSEGNPRDEPALLVFDRGADGTYSRRTILIPQPAAEFPLPHLHPRVVLLDRHVAVHRVVSDSASVVDAAGVVEVLVFDLDTESVARVDVPLDQGWALIPSGLLVASSDGALRLHAEGVAPETLLQLGANRHVTAVAALNDRHAVLGFQSGAVELWDLEQGSRIATVTQHSWPVADVAAGDSDGGLTISSTTGGSHVEVVVRRLDATILRAVACETAGRDLTPEEWEEYTGTARQLPCDRGLPE